MRLLRGLRSAANLSTGDDGSGDRALTAGQLLRSLPAAAHPLPDTKRRPRRSAMAPLARQPPVLVSVRVLHVEQVSSGYMSALFPHAITGNAVVGPCSHAGHTFVRLFDTTLMEACTACADAFLSVCVMCIPVEQMGCAGV